MGIDPGVNPRSDATVKQGGQIRPILQDDVSIRAGGLFPHQDGIHPKSAGSEGDASLVVEQGAGAWIGGAGSLKGAIK